MLSDDELRARIARQRWTAQNIVLSPAVSTIPGQIDFLRDNAILQAIRRTLSIVFPNGLRGLRVADIGCLEGAYALALAQLGAEATGIEVREENVEKCRLVRDHFRLPNLRFVCDDAKNVTEDRYGRFDVVLALGLLYHLDHPVAWLSQIGAITDRILFVETHYAPERDADLANLRSAIRDLGPLQSFEVSGARFEGRWFTEFVTDAQRDDALWASYSNARSLWLTRRSILAALRLAGFDAIYEQYDYWIEKYDMITREYPRAMFVAVKTP